MKPSNLYLDLLPFDLEAVPGSGMVPAQWAVVIGSPTVSSRRDPNSVIGPSSRYLLESHLPLEVRQNLYITSLVKQPTNAKRNLPKRSVRDSYAILIEELQAVGASRILAIGREVAESLCPGFQDLLEDHGALFQNPTLNALIVPTFYFSTVHTNPYFKQCITRDLHRWLTLSVPQPPLFQVIQDLQAIPSPRRTAVTLDIETTGLDAREGDITKVGFKFWGASEPVYILENPRKTDLQDLRDFLKEFASVIIGHNLQFDLEWLMDRTRQFWDLPVEDTMLMAHNCGEESLKLKHLTIMHTDRPGSHAFGYHQDNAYLAEDILSTEAIFTVFKNRGVRKTYIHRLVNRVIPIAAEIRWKGVPIDHQRLAQIRQDHEETVRSVTDKLNSLAPRSYQKATEGINWNSHDQVITILQKSGVKLTEKTDRGTYTVKESVLLGLRERYPIVDALLTYREEIKLHEFLVAYADRIDQDRKLNRPPRLHPRMKIHGTTTGRTSMEDPNLQQVTRTGVLKTMFISSFKNGLVGLVDLSQAELRVACLLSGDAAFAKALMSGDIHRSNAAIAYQVPLDQVTPFQRKKSKGVTFGLLYGGGAKGLAARIGAEVAEVEKIMHILFTQFPDLARYIRKTKADGVRDQRIVDHFGRIRDLSTLIALAGDRDAERKAINTPIQGLASHIALLIMGHIFYQCRAEKLRSRVLFGVHDSTILDVYPTEQDSVARIVQDAFENLNQTPLQTLSLWGTLPMVGELIYGTSWAAVESTNEHYTPLQITPVSSHPKLDLSGGRHA